MKQHTKPEPGAEIVLEGAVSSWETGGVKRDFAVLSMPYARLALIAKINVFDAVTAKGEQRGLKPPHAKKLRSEMAGGRFTPTAVTLNVKEEHRNNLNIIEDSDGRRTFKLAVERGNGLSLTDGQHRLAALGGMLEELRDRAAKAVGKEKEELDRKMLALANVDFPVVIQFGGDPQIDFANLQQGLSQDRSHLLSLRIQKMLHDPDLSFAFALAVELGRRKGSILEGRIRFDSRDSMAALPVSTLIAKSSADVSSSLLGVARVARSFDVKKVSQLADLYVGMYEALEKKAPEVLEYGKVLTSPANNGTKGALTVGVGAFIQLVYRLGALGKGKLKKFDEPEKEWLAESALEKLNGKVEGSFSSPFKRQLLGEFAQYYLSDLSDEEEDYWHRIPRGLLELLSASSLGIEPMPGTKRGRGRPPRVMEVEEETVMAKTTESQ